MLPWVQKMRFNSGWHWPQLGVEEDLMDNVPFCKLGFASELATVFFLKCVTIQESKHSYAPTLSIFIH